MMHSQKNVKLVHLVWFYHTEICYDARSHECKIIPLSMTLRKPVSDFFRKKCSTIYLLSSLGVNFSTLLTLCF